MRHALIARRAALMLGAVMLLAACEGSGNGPASPRTSEVVHLSQAPVDAVPYVASRPATPAPAPETTTLATQDKALTAQAQAEANAQPQPP